jgi:hypothetical protein
VRCINLGDPRPTRLGMVAGRLRQWRKFAPLGCECFRQAVFAILLDRERLGAHVREGRLLGFRSLDFNALLVELALCCANVCLQRIDLFGQAALIGFECLVQTPFAAVQLGL